MSFEPEIVGDEFYDKIVEHVVRIKPYIIVEIGSANGLGSTQAFIEGIRKAGIENSCELLCVELLKDRFDELVENTKDAVPGIIYHNGSTCGVDGYMSDETLAEMMTLEDVLKFSAMESSTWLIMWRFLSLNGLSP